jgi:parallel beta helix pectate lyase-like protein
MRSRTPWTWIARVAAAAVGAGALAAPAGAEPPPVPPPGSVSVNVDCAAGQTVAQALARVGRRPSEGSPAVISISGLCAERVTLRRDDVILRGSAPGAGLTSPASGGGSLVYLDGARRITLYQLTLALAAGSHDAAIEIAHGAQVHVGNTAVAGASSPAILLWDGTVAEVFDSTVSGTTAPVSQIQVTGAHLDLMGSTVKDGAGSGIGVNRGGSLTTESSLIRDHTSMGVSVGDNATALIGETEVTGNRFGISVFSNGTVSLAGPSRVADNTQSGVLAQLGAVVSAGGGTVIEGNANGIQATGGSKVQVANVSIRNNRNSGIFLGDSSYLVSAGSPTVTGNTQWGIACASSPAVPQIPFGLPSSSVTGNGSGASNCPTLGIPGQVP